MTLCSLRIEVILSMLLPYRIVFTSQSEHLYQQVNTTNAFLLSESYFFNTFYPLCFSYACNFFVKIMSHGFLICMLKFSVGSNYA